METELKHPLSVQQKVLYTLMCNAIFRCECVYILKSGKDCVDTHVETAWKKNGFRDYHDFSCYCVRYNIVKTLTADERSAYLALADHNKKNRIKRELGEEIEWQKVYDELYPEKKG